MSLHIRFGVDAQCNTHPRYNPEKDGQRHNCPGCESLWVIHLYSKIALKKASENSNITSKVVGRVVVPAEEEALVGV